MVMRIRPEAIGFFLIIVAATTADGRGWRGIVPLHSTRSQVEQLLGPPTEQDAPYSVVYRTQNETVQIYYANGRPCGVGHKYSRWRVAQNTVTEIFITPNPGSPLSELSIDQQKYKKLSGGHTSDTQYLSISDGEKVTMFGNTVRHITYFPSAADSYLQCPTLYEADLTDCEVIPEPFDSLGDISFASEKFLLDNFSLTVSDRKGMAYVIAYAGKRARPNEATERANRVKQYLVNVRGLPAEQIKVIDGGYREKRDVVLYVVSEGVCPPIPLPTIDPRDVQIVRGRR